MKRMKVISSGHLWLHHPTAPMCCGANLRPSSLKKGIIIFCVAAAESTELDTCVFGPLAPCESVCSLMVPKPRSEVNESPVTQNFASCHGQSLHIRFPGDKGSFGRADFSERKACFEMCRWQGSRPTQPSLLKVLAITYEVKQVALHVLLGISDQPGGQAGKL